MVLHTLFNKFNKYYIILNISSENALKKLVMPPLFFGYTDSNEQQTSIEINNKIKQILYFPIFHIKL